MSPFCVRLRLPEPQPDGGLSMSVFSQSTQEKPEPRIIPTAAARRRRSRTIAAIAAMKLHEGEGTAVGRAKVRETSWEQ